ncbi:MAG: IPT/TIG domain-containing protein [bacterium]
MNSLAILSTAILATGTAATAKPADQPIGVAPGEPNLYSPQLSSANMCDPGFLEVQIEYLDIVENYLEDHGMADMPDEAKQQLAAQMPALNGDRTTPYATNDFTLYIAGHCGIGEGAMSWLGETALAWVYDSGFADNPFAKLMPDHSDILALYVKSTTPVEIIEPEVEMMDEKRAPAVVVSRAITLDDTPTGPDLESIDLKGSFVEGQSFQLIINGKHLKKVETDKLIVTIDGTPTTFTLNKQGAKQIVLKNLSATPGKHKIKVSYQGQQFEQEFEITKKPETPKQAPVIQRPAPKAANPCDGVEDDDIRAALGCE